MATLTENQKLRIMQIQGIQWSTSLLGGILGVVYSHKTGGGFWRGLGYYFLGSIAFGIPAAVIATPFKNKIIKETAANDDVSKIEIKPVTPIGNGIVGGADTQTK